MKELREARRLSVAELARQAEVSRQTIYMIEDGRQTPTLDTARKLARALNVPMEQL